MAKDDLAAAVEKGLADQWPDLLSQEQLELFELRTMRQRAADEMATRARAAMAPLAFAAAIFLPGGPADLLLSIAPVHKLGKLVEEIVKRGKAARKKSKKSKQLVAIMGELEEALDAADWQFLWITSRLSPTRQAALATIAKRTESGSLVRALVDKVARGRDLVDLEWIASKLKSGALDAKTARRFEFDADFADAFTRYQANPSWSVLERVVDKRRVSAGERQSLVIKMTGLLGEQAAAAMVGTRGFARKYFSRADRKLAIDRGVGYGGNKSLDIAAYSDEGEAVFAEVKNWSVRTWEDASQRRKVLEQLERHNAGIDSLTIGGSEYRTVEAKLLIVRKEPFLEEFAKVDRETFEKAVEALGWRLDYIPSGDVPKFGDVIDAMRK